MVDYKRGDILEVDLKGAVGSEHKNDASINARLCLVVQNDKGNEMSPVTIVAPITDARNDKALPVQVLLKEGDRGPLDKDSIVHCGQLRTVDRSHRVRKNIGALSGAVMARVDLALQASLALT